jgi:hypothetical protein
MLSNSDWQDVFAPNGRLLEEGEIIRRTNLSRTLATIAEEGPEAFYKVNHFRRLHMDCTNVSRIGSHRRLYRREGSSYRWHPHSCRPRVLQGHRTTCTGRHLQGQEGLHLKRAYIWSSSTAHTKSARALRSERRGSLWAEHASRGRSDEV